MSLRRDAKVYASQFSLLIGAWCKSLLDKCLAIDNNCAVRQILLS